MDLELRLIRSFVAVAERRSFTRAAEDLHIAQQAVSQQIKALESTLGVTLLRRNARVVELTPAGAVFLIDAKRMLSAANRAAGRAQAAARGEAGTLRVGYTLTVGYDTMPALLDLLGTRYPQLKIDAREVYGGDIADMLEAQRFDVGLAPATTYPTGFDQQPIRRERLRLAVGTRHALAHRAKASLVAVRRERFELWPRDMAPGYYDAVIAACRAAGFEPTLDEHAAGSTVWGYIGRGRGVALVVGSIAQQLPRGVRLLDPTPAPPLLTISAVWRHGMEVPAIHRLLDATGEIGTEHHWI